MHRPCWPRTSSCLSTETDQRRCEPTEAMSLPAMQRPMIFGSRRASAVRSPPCSLAARSFRGSAAVSVPWGWPRCSPRQESMSAAGQPRRRRRRQGGSRSSRSAGSQAASLPGSSQAGDLPVHERRTVARRHLRSQARARTICRARIRPHRSRPAGENAARSCPRRFRRGLMARAESR